MLRRTILQQRRYLPERSSICIFCENAVTNRSRRGPKAPRLLISRSNSRHESRRALSSKVKGGSGFESPRETRLPVVVERGYQDETRSSGVNQHQVDANTALAIEQSRRGGKSLLEAAYKDGALRIKPETVSKLLQQLAQFSIPLSPTHLRNACAGLNISIDDAYTLARLLLKSLGPLDRQMGRQILLQASALGSAKATIFVAKTAIKSKQLGTQEVQPAIQQLKVLAVQQPPLVPAQVAQAKVYEEQGMYDEAEELYKAVISHIPFSEQPSRVSGFAKRLRERLATSGPEVIAEEKKFTVEDKDTELDVVAAHIGLAHIQYHVRHEHSAAVKNWEIAALEYDDPSAYYNLALNIETNAREATGNMLSKQDIEHKDRLDPESRWDNEWVRFVTPQWFEYMMKAAASGHPEACYKIGLFYMVQQRGFTDKIVDSRVQDILRNSPLMQARPRTIGRWLRPGSGAATKEENQTAIVKRWLECGAAGGSEAAKEAIRLFHESQAKDDETPGDSIWS